MSIFEELLRLMARKQGSDLYFTTGAAPGMRISGVIHPVGRSILKPGQVKRMAYSVMTGEQQTEFENELELNFALSRDTGRYRVNVYLQRGEVSMVIRYIHSDIPSLESLSLPMTLKKMVMQKQGLLLVVGATGSGKSSTLASLLDYRNKNRSGHILTIEDPIEYLFKHGKSIVGQREVGLDTRSYESALKEAMREAPDVIMIGEARDRRTIEAAINFADTGHLCVTTLHAVNTYQAIDRIVNMFPSSARNQILMDLSLNLNGVIAQRLVKAKSGQRYPAVELMTKSAYISELIRTGSFHKIKDVMAKGNGDMRTFDQSLAELYQLDRIDLETALDSADSRTDLEWKLNFGGSNSDAVKTSAGEYDETIFIPPPTETP